MSFKTTTAGHQDMCELLIRIRDKVNADPYLDAKCTKRGDVIVVLEDGWGWAQGELTNPDWRILRVPAVTVGQAAAFVTPEVDTDPAHPSRVLQRRGFRINLEGIAINGAWTAWIADDTRAAPARTLSATLAQLTALRVKKPALIDPNVLD